MPIHSSITHTVGLTPLIFLNRIAEGLPRAARQVAARAENAGKLIVTVGCSTGERYLSTALADDARQQVSA